VTTPAQSSDSQSVRNLGRRFAFAIGGATLVVGLGLGLGACAVKHDSRIPVSGNTPPTTTLAPPTTGAPVTTADPKP
jgi:hypothetical protein